eukprot:945759-Pleurochrysis_carterae.AAC.2
MVKGVAAVRTRRRAAMLAFVRRHERSERLPACVCLACCLQCGYLFLKRAKLCHAARGVARNAAAVARHKLCRPPAAGVRGQCALRVWTHSRMI